MCATRREFRAASNGGGRLSTVREARWLSPPTPPSVSEHYHIALLAQRMAEINRFVRDPTVTDFSIVWLVMVVSHLGGTSGKGSVTLHIKS